MQPGHANPAGARSDAATDDPAAVADADPDSTVADPAVADPDSTAGADASGADAATAPAGADAATAPADVARPPDLIGTNRNTLPAGAAPHGAAPAASRHGLAVVNAWHMPRYVVVDDLLAPDENAWLLDYVLSRQADFGDTAVNHSDGSEAIDPEYRSSKNIWADDLEHFHVSRKMWEIVSDFAADILVEQRPLELQFTGEIVASNDGDWFRAHYDGSNTDTRVITFIYYFHTGPRGFDGGGLRLFANPAGPDHPEMSAAGHLPVVEIEPRNNRLVVFHSRQVHHEVMTVRCPSRRFADSRFTVNGWLITPEGHAS